MHAVRSAIGPPTEKKTDEHVLPLVTFLICIATIDNANLCPTQRLKRESHLCAWVVVSFFVWTRSRQVDRVFFGSNNREVPTLGRVSSGPWQVEVLISTW